LPMPEIRTVQEILNRTVDFFEQRHIAEPRLSAELLLCHVLQLRRIDLYLQFERILSPEELNRARHCVQRRGKHEPVQYITGEQEFMGFPFKVTPAVLIPRQETELLVEAVLEEVNAVPEENPAILDVGTGSGAIAISLARLCPGCRITAVDNSAEALDVARENARLLETPQVEFILADALQPSFLKDRRFNFIVSNPPYIGREQAEILQKQVSRYEPHKALFAGKEGLEFYKHFLPLAPGLLQPGGKLLMEIGFDQKEKVLTLFRQNQFSHMTFIKDLQNINRVIKAEKTL
ncbi:MAG: peptide chain release factor N(5)-glutamine methyltransferase, partial [Calditrichia bacterium]